LYNIYSCSYELQKVFVVLFSSNSVDLKLFMTVFVSGNTGCCSISNNIVQQTYLHIEYVFEVSRRKLSGENFNGVRKNIRVPNILLFLKKQKCFYVFSNRISFVSEIKFWQSIFLSSFQVGVCTECRTVEMSKSGLQKVS
jgi:hypothetical protein